MGALGRWVDVEAAWGGSGRRTATLRAPAMLAPAARKKTVRVSYLDDDHEGVATISSWVRRR